MTKTSELTTRAVLACNANPPHPIIGGIEASLAWNEAHALVIRYLLVANTRNLRIPASAAPRRVDGLWQHTCFEAFIRQDGSSSYYEFNFSPSGEWAAYAFRDYRIGGPLDGDGLAPAISLQRSTDSLELVAVVNFDFIPAIKPGSILRLGLSAVIEGSDGRLSYWALKHPAEKPDFHHPDSFTLEFALPTARP